MSKSGGPTTGVFIKCCVDKGVLIPTRPLIKKVKFVCTWQLKPWRRLDCRRQCCRNLLRASRRRSRPRGSSSRGWSGPRRPCRSCPEPHSVELRCWRVLNLPVFKTSKRSFEGTCLKLAFPSGGKRPPRGQHYSGHLRPSLFVSVLNYSGRIVNQCNDCCRSLFVRQSLNTPNRRIQAKWEQSNSQSFLKVVLWIPFQADFTISLTSDFKWRPSLHL